MTLAHPAWSEFAPQSDGRVWVGAGLRLKNLCGLAGKAGLTGFEFLEGIPGSVGGALRMNAGAMGGWMFDVVDEVRLMTDDGEAVTDSPLICAYLDALSGAPRLLPPEGDKHWRVRRLETLGDAVLEMAVKIALEGRRPETERSPTWIGWWTDGLKRALDQAEARVPGAGPLDLGKIALGVAGPYVDFRLPQLNWRATRPFGSKSASSGNQ